MVTSSIEQSPTSERFATDPSPPRNVAITRAFQDGVELNWLPPTEPNGEVHYVIEYKREDSGSWTSVNTTSDSTHYNLTGLHSSTNYTIRVVAVNMMKQASFTMSSTATPTSSSTATLNTGTRTVKIHTHQVGICRVQIVILNTVQTPSGMPWSERSVAQRLQV